MIVNIGKSAFDSVLVACAEGFPLEVVGLLFGFEKESRYHIQVAYPIQLSERTEGSVLFSQQVVDRIKDAAKHSTGYHVLGVYHSHTDANPEFSEKDLAALAQMELPLCLLVAMNRSSTQSSTWQAKGNSSLTGHSGGFTYVVRCLEERTMEMLAIESAYVKVQNLLYENFRLSYIDLYKLDAEALDRAQYQIDKLFYRVKRESQRGSSSYDASKKEQHINRLAAIFEQAGLLDSWQRG